MTQLTGKGRRDVCRRGLMAVCRLQGLSGRKMKIEQKGGQGGKKNKSRAIREEKVEKEVLVWHTRTEKPHLANEPKHLKDTVVIEV
ncbi:Galactosylgalactosylxylosylprotein 3-beta-glucuronosyltransferase 2 [Liparis tanakae]|uniref:Galactosylgalactosylxylosylprotein 3-beta-glucuronosyltransferase 2 n=1 Tax=Liparis tanakae TaxID=230148 RepID=A0A4Z2HHV4_9TELE|nr:Galactosylgalactosylxylosylprotein 3-beta-glucuronosyltransferase 2 [Liparis tanakae]